MIMLTRLNGANFALNPDLIERAESTPDTVITLVDGKHYLVEESLAEVIALVQRSRAAVLAEVSASQARTETAPLVDDAATAHGHGHGHHALHAGQPGEVIPMRRNT